MVKREHDEFLDEIIAAPDDDGPRLIYADWLEEAGNPRGEFIRLQCEMAKLPRWSPEYLDLAEKSEALRAMHFETWEANLPELAKPQFEKPFYKGIYHEHYDIGVAQQNYRRGFIDEVGMSREQFVQSGSDVAATIPSPRFVVNEIDDQGQGFVSIPDASGIRRLFLIFENSGMGIDVGKTFFPFEDVTELSLRNKPALRDADLQQLSQLSCFKRLTFLDVYRNQLTNAGMTCLATSDAFSSLQRLHLGSNPIGDDGLRKLTQSKLSAQLIELKLKNTKITDEGLAHLAHAEFPQLKILSIGGNDSDHFTAQGFRSMAESESIAGLSELNLNFTSLQPAMLKMFLKSNFLERLQNLSLANTGFDDEMATALFPSLACKLFFLDLRENELSAAGVSSLVNSAAAQRLTRLSLDQCANIRDDGAAALANSPNLQNLRSLSLGGGGITETGAKEIASSPHLANLRFLYLDDNEIGEQGALAIASSPYLRKIEHLSLLSCGCKGVAAQLRERFGDAVEIRLGDPKYYRRHPQQF